MIKQALGRPVILKNLGLMSYTSAMAIMNSIAQQKQNFKCGKTSSEPLDHLLICQHKPVYTVGIRKKDYMDESVIKNLKSLNSEFHYTDRGGLITFHGPGQLVCYPVLNLKHYKLSIRCYINMLEDVLIRTCQHYDIDAHRTENVGIWVGENKIAAIGVHCRRYITSHGLALNCDTDLKWFDHIVPCGIPDKGVTSITKELSKVVAVDETMPVLMKNFEKVFSCNVVDKEPTK